MLLALIRKEIVNHVLSLRFAITFVLFFVLVQASIFVMTGDYETALRTHEASEATQRDRLSALEAVEDANQQVNDLLYNQGVLRSRAPQTLSILARGLEDRLPTQVHTSLRESQRISEKYYDNPVYALFATPDYSYIVNVVVSLLALLFVFDAICGEKESGTLKLVLANRVPRDQVLLAKWIGGYLSLAAPFLVAVQSGVTYVYLTGVIQLEGEAVERLLWIVCVSLVYISLFFTLGMLISTLTHKAATALLVALFVWVCWILVIPNLSPVVAKMIAPVPTLQTLGAQKTAVDMEVDIRIDRFLRKNYVTGHKREQAIEDIQQEGERRKQRMDQYYQDRLKAQIGIGRTVSRLSPSASFTYAVTDLASTGTGLYENFRRGYKRFEDEFRTFGEGILEQRDDDELPDHWFQVDRIPDLHIAPARLDDTVDAVLTDLLLLGVFNVLFFMLAFVCFLRYDIT